MVTAILLKMNYTSPSDRPLRPFTQPHRGTPNHMPLGLVTLAKAVAAHIAEGGRLRQVVLAYERIQKEIAERVEAA